MAKISFGKKFCITTKVGIHGVFIFNETRYLVPNTPLPITWIGIHADR